MFVVVFQASQQSQIQVTPLLMPLSAEILDKPVSYLQELCFNHFRDHLSPFIRKQHFELATLNTTMKPDYPLFVYCNFKQFINNLICTLKSFDESANLKRSYLLKHSIVLINSKNQSERIFKVKQVEKIDKIIRQDQPIYVQGKQLRLAYKNNVEEQIEYIKKWSQLVIQKWNKFQSANNCIYILI